MLTVSAAAQVTMCAAASLITPRAVVPGRLDVSASQLHFVGDPPAADASTGAAQVRWTCTVAPLTAPLPWWALALQIQCSAVVC